MRKGIEWCTYDAVDSTSYVKNYQKFKRLWGCDPTKNFKKKKKNKILWGVDPKIN